MKVNFAKKLKKSLLLLSILPLLFATSCSKEDDPDPKANFMGSFEMKVSEILYLPNNTRSVNINEPIEFRINEQLGQQELETTLEEFIENIFETYYSYHGFNWSLQAIIDGPAIAEISGSKFEIDRVYGEVTNHKGFTYDWSFKAVGKLKDGQLTMDFLISTGDKWDPKGVISGTAIGKKE